MINIKSNKNFALIAANEISRPTELDKFQTTNFRTWETKFVNRVVKDNNGK